MSDLAFHALREYVPGDELRHVHWRSSAKAGALQIRQYHDTRRSHLSVVIDDDRHSYGDAEDFEVAVSSAASIAARADRDGVDLSLLCGEHAVTGRGLDAVLDVCCRIELGSSDPVTTARQALRLAPETSWLVLFTGGEAPAALSSVLRAGLPPDVSLLLVTADGSAPTKVSRLSPAARWLRLRTLDELPPGVAPGDAAGAVVSPGAAPGSDPTAAAPARGAVVLVDLVAIMLLVGLALVGLAGTFAGWQFLVVGLVGGALALLIVICTMRLPVEVLAAALPVGAIVLGGPVALRQGGFGAGIPDAQLLAHVMVWSVTSWHELLTTLPFVDLSGPPALVPYLLGFGGAGIAGVLALRGRSAGLPLLPVFGVLVAVLLLRRPQTGVQDWYPVGFAVVAVVWLVLRGLEFSVTESTDVRGRQHGRVARAVTAAVVVAAALAMAVPLTGGRPASVGSTLRGQVHATSELAGLDSPLRRFRTFTEQPALGTGNVHHKLLFTVTDAPPGSRLRMVTLDTYDGREWLATDDSMRGESDDAFLRMDSRGRQPDARPARAGPGERRPGVPQRLGADHRVADLAALPVRRRRLTPRAAALQPGDVDSGDPGGHPRRQRLRVHRDRARRPTERGHASVAPAPAQGGGAPAGRLADQEGARQSGHAHAQGVRARDVPPRRGALQQRGGARARRSTSPART